jgi:hypothetical protein
MLRFLKGLNLIILAVLILIITVAAAFGTVILVSAGLLTVFVSLGVIIGLLGTVASDLSPPAMLFTGLFCVFSAISLSLVIYIYCPKVTVKYINSAGRFFS